MIYTPSGDFDPPTHYSICTCKYHKYDEASFILSYTQLEVARRHIDYHMQQFGYDKPNVEFVEGYIERLGEAGLQNGSYDIIM